MKTEKNKDKITESQKSQLEFEYNVHLLNYTIKNLKNVKTYIGLLKLGVLKPNSTALHLPLCRFANLRTGQHSSVSTYRT